VTRVHSQRIALVAAAIAVVIAFGLTIVHAQTTTPVQTPTATRPPSSGTPTPEETRPPSSGTPTPEATRPPSSGTPTPEETRPPSSGTPTPEETLTATPTVTDTPTVTATPPLGPTATPTLSATPTAGAATPTVTPTPAAPAKNKCDSGKVKCVDKKQDCLLKEHSKAEKEGVPVDDAKVQEKLQKCIDKFDGGTKGPEKGCIGKLEGKQKQDKPDTRCTVTDDLAALEAKVDAFVLDVVSEIDPSFPAVQPPNKCNPGKKKCVSKKVSCKLKARADAVKKGVPVDGAKLQKCIDKFDGGTKGPEKGCIGKLEGKQKQDKPDTLCTVTDDLAALEAKADAFVADIVSEITSVP
jgi:hypothetical protein